MRGDREILNEAVQMIEALGWVTVVARLSLSKRFDEPTISQMRLAGISGNLVKMIAELLDSMPKNGQEQEGGTA